MLTTLDGGLIAALVDKLEVVALAAVLIGGLDNLAVGYVLGAEDAIFVVGQTGEDLIGFAVAQTYESDPFLLIVLEAHHVGFEFHRAFHLMVGLMDQFDRLLLLGRDGFEHIVARAVAIHRASLATGLPGFHIELAHEFRYVGL